MNDHVTVARRISEQLEDVRRRSNHPSLEDAPVTVVCVTRHGYATTKVNLESAYGNTGVDFITFYLDINSPPAARDYLVQQARTRKGFFHIRIDEWISRQTARRLVLDLVPSPFTVFMDNNMLFSPGWLEGLLEAAREPAQVVSPFIVTQGGRVHFSGSRLRKRPDGTIARRQNTRDCPLASRLEDVQPEKREIDFGESHCCLIATDGYRRLIPSVFPEEMHNAHTLGFATYLLKSEHGLRMVVEPRALASVLPVGFGYDIPWLFESYMDLECFRKAYDLYGARIGRSGSTTIGNLRWHRKHLLYLLLSMLERDFLDRTTLMEPHEVPESVDGYDRPLPDDAEERIAKQVIPFVNARYPRYAGDLAFWLNDGRTFLQDINSLIAGLRDARAQHAADAPG